MKNFLLILTVCIFYVASNGQCIDPNLINPNGICTLQYEPVCGCDGKQYSNPCFAQKQGGVTSYTNGDCPIAETYTICEGESVQIGLSGFIGNTIMSWSPTTGLSCATCANPKASPGSTTIYELKIFTTIGQTTAYSYYEVVVEPDCPCICPAVYLPVCGSDGITYSNECEAHCAGIYEFYDGVCTDICSNGSIFSSTYKYTIGTADVPQTAASDIYCFNAEINNNNICTWYWDFGNGIISTQQNPEDITFAVISNGQPITSPYEICLTVYDCNNVDLGACCENFHPQGISVCNLPPDVGFCDAVIPRWYYDANLQDCLPFTYGGCDGNANNFGSYTACIAACDCYDPSLVNPSIICTADYSPVCGCDGNTYSNACAATNWHGIASYTPGECACAYTNWYTAPNCNSCIESVQLIQFNGQQYIAFWGDNTQCADAISTVYNCDGSIFCYEGGFAGFTQCSDAGLIGNYTVLNTLWDVNNDCNTCDYEDWLTLPTCNSCIQSVQTIQFNGQQYIAFWGDNEQCADAISTVYNCDGSIFCYEGGFAGFTQCSDAGLKGNYTVLSTLWDVSNDCNTCDYEDWLTKPTCSDCYASVEQIEFNGNQYIAFWQSNYTGDGAVCSDQISIVYHCDGSVFCYEGGFAGFSQCSDAGLITNYTTTNTLWSQYIECGICALPADPGFCLAYIPRWYYNASKGECQQFVWGGCGGNANNFTTFEACMEACNSFSGCPPVLNLEANPISSGVYQADVTTISYGYVTTGSEVTLKAGTNIELKNGFSIPKDCDVKVEINPCE